MEPVRYKDGAERCECGKHFWQCSGAGPTWRPLTQTEGILTEMGFCMTHPSESHLCLNSILKCESGGCWICRRLHRAQLRTSVPLVPVREQNRAAVGEQQESKGEISKCKQKGQTRLAFSLKNYPSAKCSNQKYNCNFPGSLSKRGWPLCGSWLSLFGMCHSKRAFKHERKCVQNSEANWSLHSNKTKKNYIDIEMKGNLNLVLTDKYTITCLFNI